MNVRTLLSVFLVASACLLMTGPSSAQDTKKKAKEIVVVGSKLNAAEGEEGATKELPTDKKEGKENSSSFGVEREMKESGEKGGTEARSAERAQPRVHQPRRARAPADTKRPLARSARQECEEGQERSCVQGKPCECAEPPKPEK